MAREVRLYGLIYTRIRQSRVYYIRDGPRERRGGRELSGDRGRDPPLAQSQGQLPTVTYLSLSLFSSPYPFLFDPLVKGLGTPRVACPVIPVKRIISLFETLAILWSPPLFIPGRCVGWWRVARCASSLFVSSYSPVFRIRGDTRVRVHAVYYTVRRREWPSNARPRCLLRGARHVEAVGAWNSRRQTGGEGGVDGLSTAGRVAIPPRLLLQNTLINDSSEQIYLHY